MRKHYIEERKIKPPFGFEKQKGGFIA